MRTGKPVAKFAISPMSRRLRHDPAVRLLARSDQRGDRLARLGLR